MSIAVLFPREFERSNVAFSSSSSSSYMTKSDFLFVNLEGVLDSLIDKNKRVLDLVSGSDIVVAKMSTKDTKDTKDDNSG